MTEENKTTVEDTQILFFCKDCQWVVVNPKKHPKRYEYKCPMCEGKKVVFGTENAIVDYFNIKEAALERMLKEPNKKTS